MKTFLFSPIFVLLSLLVEASAEQLIIVSPHWEGIRYEFQAGFERWRVSRGLAPVDIQWRDIGGTSEIVRFVQSEFKGNRQGGQSGIGVDLIFGGGIDPFVTFKKGGLLQAVSIDEAILNKVAKQASGIPLYDKEGFWYAPTMSAFGIFCNRKVLSELSLTEPHSWEDLLNPAFESWITSADPRRSGSAHMFYEIILQSFGWSEGWKLILALTRNYRTILSNSSQAILDVVNGEVACCFAIDSQANAHISKTGSNEFSFTVPEKGSLFNGDGIAMLRGASNPEAARSFIEFSLSESGQNLLFKRKGEEGGPLMYDLNRLPVLPHFYTDARIVKLNPFRSGRIYDQSFNSDLSASRWEAINDLLGIFAIEAKDAGILNETECDIGLPQDYELTELIEAGVWRDQVKRNQQLSLWRSHISDCENSYQLFLKTLPFLLILLLISGFLLKKNRK